MFARLVDESVRADRFQFASLCTIPARARVDFAERKVKKRRGGAMRRESLGSLTPVGVCIFLRFVERRPAKPQRRGNFISNVYRCVKKFQRRGKISVSRIARRR